MAPTKLKPAEFIEKYFSEMKTIVDSSCYEEKYFKLFMKDGSRYRSQESYFYDYEKVYEFYLNNNGNRTFSKETVCKLLSVKIEEQKLVDFRKYLLKNIYTEAAAMAPSFVFNKTIEANIESENESDNESKYDTDNDIECESSMDIEIQDEAIIEPFINIRKLENWIDNQCRFSEREIYNRDNWESVFDWFYNDTLTELSYSEFN